MMGFNFWALVIAVLAIIPLWKMLPDYGIPSWVSLVCVIPFGLIVLLWVMAFKDRLDGTRA